MGIPEQIKKIFQLYVGKRFSLRGRILFAKWIRAEHHQTEKSLLLQQLWEASADEAYTETKEDWLSLQKDMQRFEIQSREWKRTWAKYVAAAGLVGAIAGGSLYWGIQEYESRRAPEMAELFVPYGNDKVVTLPDNSKAWVKAGSLLIYPKDFKGKNTRSIYLTGEATFQVQKNKEQPFIVKTACLDVQALGTVFTVESYPDDAYTVATLKEGSVLVRMKNETQETVMLEPSEQLLYSHIKHSGVVRNVNLNTFDMERKGYLIFENATLSQIIPALERKYNVAILYQPQQHTGEKYNVKFSPEESLDEVMTVLHQLIGLRYTVKGNRVIIN